MAYDFYTDIKNLTGLNPTNSVMDWAVDMAKTFYIADDPANYDEELSDVDNRLVSMLASGFVIMHNFGTSVAGTFKLDEFSVEENNETKPESKFFNMFFEWLALYHERNVTLQYVVASDSMLVSVYDPTIYETTRTEPAGI